MSPVGNEVPVSCRLPFITWAKHVAIWQKLYGTQECMADGTRTLKQCLHDRTYSHECKEYRVAYFECKRGQLDMRQRIRGPKGGMSKPTEEN
ncbi:hypothetical protein DD237_000927 [Peronospora effusa]|uniref:Uncharacterized protein n=1 Tax=Peronospora effusa TaxID=542832 RepID=A0A425CP36_9STRA|nr:hypothetical protein DD237_000927 [Peronospora effusa]